MNVMKHGVVANKITVDLKAMEIGLFFYLFVSSNSNDS